MSLPKRLIALALMGGALVTFHSQAIAQDSATPPAQQHWWQKGRGGTTAQPEAAPRMPEPEVNSDKAIRRRYVEKMRKLKAEEAKADPKTTRMWYYDPYESTRKCLSWDEAQQARLNASNALRPCYDTGKNGTFERDKPADF